MIKKSNPKSKKQTKQKKTTSKAQKRNTPNPNPKPKSKSKSKKKETSTIIPTPPNSQSEWDIVNMDEDLLEKYEEDFDESNYDDENIDQEEAYWDDNQQQNSPQLTYGSEFNRRKSSNLFEGHLPQQNHYNSQKQIYPNRKAPFQKNQHSFSNQRGGQHFTNFHGQRFISHSNLPPNFQQYPHPQHSKQNLSSQQKIVQHQYPQIQIPKHPQFLQHSSPSQQWIPSSQFKLSQQNNSQFWSQNDSDISSSQNVQDFEQFTKNNGQDNITNHQQFTNQNDNSSNQFSQQNQFHNDNLTAKERETEKQFYQNSINQLNNYIHQRSANDGDITHRLLFQFFKAQAIYENKNQDLFQVSFYEKFKQKYQEEESKLQPNQDESQQLNDSQTFHDANQQKFSFPSSSLNQNFNNAQTVFEEIKPQDQTISSKGNKSITKDKFQTGKFMSFNKFAGDDDLGYDFSSEDEILQQNCFDDLMRKINGKQKNKSKYQGSNDGRKYNGSSSKRQSKQKNNPVKKKPKNFQEDSDYEVHYDSSESEDQWCNFDEQSDDSSSGSRRENVSSNSEQEESEEQIKQDFRHLDRYEDEQEMKYEMKTNQKQNNRRISYQSYEEDQDDEEADDHLSKPNTNQGKEKKVHGAQAYHSIQNKGELQRYFRKLTKNYQSDLKTVREETNKKLKQKERLTQMKGEKPKSQKSVRFDDIVNIKVFRSEAEPKHVALTNEVQQTSKKAIWEFYD